MGTAEMQISILKTPEPILFILAFLLPFLFTYSLAPEEELMNAYYIHLA
jgi:hypothetical protein